MVTGEADSPQTIAAYRRLGSPKLLFVPLHKLEVRNAILQRAFYQRRSMAAGERRQIARERDAALARLDQLVACRALLDVMIDMEATLTCAAKLATTHTERMGARAIDLLHVASALTLESEMFLTTDARQAQLAKAEGLRIISVG